MLESPSQPLQNQLFLFWPRHLACGILVPQPGVEPRCLAVKERSPNHWTAREFLFFFFFKGNCLQNSQLIVWNMVRGQLYLPTSHEFRPKMTNSNFRFVITFLALFFFLLPRSHFLPKSLFSPLIKICQGCVSHTVDVTVSILMSWCLFAHLPVIFRYCSLKTLFWPEEFGFCCVCVLEEGRKQFLRLRVRPWIRCFHIRFG